MIIDKLENLNQYNQLRKYEKTINNFIEMCKNKKLEEGQYNLIGEEVFALVQIYQTKSKIGARMESHKEYADLQYILEGREVIYYDCVKELIVFEDKTPEDDILFYEVGKDKGGITLERGMFGYFAPQDAHMPCIQCEEKNAVKMVKIVFKIHI
ncbi:MAG: YhcH/YjgK/YiaL family protein [Lachnotalea sp.]